MTFKVSTSEVSTFLTCRQRWMYSHHPSYHLEPKTLGIALSRGIIGHEALEIYYKNLSAGYAEEDCRKSVLSFVTIKSLEAFSVGDSEKSKMITGLGILLNDYFNVTADMLKAYNIVGVEEIVTAPVADGIDFAGRIDLLLEGKYGEDKGYLVPWDHKFTYNAWPDMSIKLNPQISNYVWALQQMGHRSKGGVISMIRYRDNAVDSFIQERVPIKTKMRDTFITNHTTASKEIVRLKQIPSVSIEDGVTRSASKFNCEYCPFAQMCYNDANGIDSKLMRQVNYRPNSYGYDSELDVA